MTSGVGSIWLLCRSDLSRIAVANDDCWAWAPESASQRPPPAWRGSAAQGGWRPYVNREAGRTCG